MLNTETWKEVLNLPYEVSSLGNVRRNPNSRYKYKNRTNICPYLNNKGYVCVNLYNQCKVYKRQVHRLVAEAFIPNPDDLPEVNHIDGNPHNNTVENLEWCTHQYNMQHSWDTGLHKNYHVCASVKRKGSSSRYKGVSWSESRQRWCVYVGYKKKHYGIGRFKDEIEAAKAYDEFIKSHDMLKDGYTLNFS